MMSRSPSIPSEFQNQVHELHRVGLGARRIVTALERAGCWTTKSSVHRLLTCQAPYGQAEERET